MKLEYLLNRDQCHSFDAYYKNAKLVMNRLFIPYVNLGIRNHELNDSNEMLFLNKCVIIVDNISFLSVYKKGILIDDYTNDNKQDFFFGGLNLSNDQFIDNEGKCDRVILSLLRDTKFSNEFWIPINTPNLKINMNAQEVDSLFDYDYSKDWDNL